MYRPDPFPTAHADRIGPSVWGQVGGRAVAIYCSSDLVDVCGPNMCTRRDRVVSPTSHGLPPSSARVVAAALIDEGAADRAIELAVEGHVLAHEQYARDARHAAHVERVGGAL